jgi:hypothetical protein
MSIFTVNTTSRKYFLERESFKSNLKSQSISDASDLKLHAISGSERFVPNLKSPISD